MLSLDKVKVSKPEAEKILDLISNHGKLYKQRKTFTPEALLKMLKVEVTVGRRRAFVAERLRMLYNSARATEEQKEVAQWLAK